MLLDIYIQVKNYYSYEWTNISFSIFHPVLLWYKNKKYKGDFYGRK